MRREIRRGATIWALLFSMSGSLAVSSRVQREPAPVADTSVISDALCGRENRQRARAEALDRLGAKALSGAWRSSKVADLELWLKAPICLDAIATETALFEHRRGTLEQIRSRVERARTTELVEAALVPFRRRQPRSDPWPTSWECPACAALRMAATRVAAVAASRWPERKQAEDLRVGPRLDAAARREPLIAELCAAKPSPDVRAEIESGFRYYSWTAGGAELLEIAALFERPEVVAGCRSR